MKKWFVVLGLLLILVSPVFASAPSPSDGITNDDVILYSENEKWGLKDCNGEILTEPIYKKMIRIGYHTWLVQGKNDKFGITDEVGNVIIDIKYRHADRLLGKYAKLGNDTDYGLYNEFGELLIPHKYSKIDILFGQMFLTYKNYKYGIIGFDGKTILENNYDDIYMPSRNVMRILYKGEWYQIEQVNAQTLTLPEDAFENIYNTEGIDLYKFVKDTGVVSGYSVLTLSDYIIKLISSISPAHEETIDELMLSHGADTISIYKKFTWLPKYPFTYARKYFQIIKNPNSGPLTDFRNDLKRKMN
jgi:hypothetical protein